MPWGESVYECKELAKRKSSDELIPMLSGVILLNISEYLSVKLCDTLIIVDASAPVKSFDTINDKGALMSDVDRGNI